MLGIRGGNPVAKRVTWRATDMYRSMCAVVKGSADAILSKLPSAVGSPGSNSITSTSIPNSSLMALLYSYRFIR